ncbi:MAG TPA: hypothetical protein VMS37_14165 [Verrucomicrobiae bacterium]|nr:hypothetical protein [Verrucomicrobiae bacterium]
MAATKTPPFLPIALLTLAKTFAPETKDRAVKMTKEIEAAMERDIQTLPWMGEGTRRQALAKLNKIGKPLDRGEWGMTPPTSGGEVDVVHLRVVVSVHLAN